MKKILLLLITIYTFSFSLTGWISEQTRFSGSYYYTIGASGEGECVSSSGWIQEPSFYQGSTLYYAKTFVLNYKSVEGSSCYSSTRQTTFYSRADSNSPTPPDGLLCPTKYIDTDYGIYECLENGSLFKIDPPSNGSMSLAPDKDEIQRDCDDGYSLSGNLCLIPPSNGSYSPDGEKQCDDGYFPTGSSNNALYCMNTPYTPDNNDGSCPSGWTPATDLTTGKLICNPPSYSTGGDTSGGSTGSTGGDTSGGSTGSTGGDISGGGSTGGDTSSGSSGSTGGDTSGGSTGGDTSGGSTGGDTSGGGSTGSGGGSVSGGSGGGTTTGGDNTDTTNPDSEQAGQSSAYLCQDGGKSLTTASGMQSCDRTCEQVGLITNTLNNTCYGDKECPEGETRTGWNGMTGEPFCYKLSNDTNLNKSETLLAKIADNTSINKNSNTQLGSINSKVNVTNAKLEAVKGGLATINTSINTNLDQINNEKFKNDDSIKELTTMKNDNNSIFEDAKKAYDNLKDAYSLIKENYTDLESFINQKKEQHATIDIANVTLQKSQMTLFGQTKSFDCFFNQDLNKLFAPIAPFITFMLNILFVYLSIKLFMNYALSIKGVA